MTDAAAPRPEDRVEEIRADLSIPWAALESQDGAPHMLWNHRQAECPHPACLFNAAQGRLRDHVGFLLDELAERDAALARLQESLGILVRACEAGAYVGKTSPAVTQARNVWAHAAPTSDGGKTDWWRCNDCGELVDPEGHRWSCAGRKGK